MSDSLLRVAFDATADGILVVGRDGVVLDFNRRFAELWRVPSDVLATGREQLILRHVLAQLVDPDGFVREVSRLYATDEETTDALDFLDGRVFERYTHALAVNGERARLWSFRDVTAHRAAEQELQRERLRLRAIVRAIPDLVWLKSPDGRYLACNEGFERYFGAPEEEIVGKRDEDFVDEALAAFFRQKDREALALGRPNVNEEWLTFASDGRHALFETIKTPVRAADGAPLGVLGVARDVTSRHEFEAAQRQSEESFRALFDGVSDGIFLHDAETGAIVNVNARVEEMYGYTAAEMRGMDASLLSLGEPPYGQAEAVALIARALAGETPTVEWVARRRDGSTFWVEVTLRLADLAGLRRVVVLVRAIGDRKRAEAALQKSRADLQAILDNFPFLVWLKDERSRFVAVNRPFAVAAGRSAPEGLVGKDDFDVWPRALAEAYRADDREVLASAQRKNVEERVVDRGEDRWMETFKAPVFDAAGVATGTVGFARDVTDRKLGEERIRAALAEKDALLREVHHRVKNNLAVIISLIGLQAAEIDDPRTVAKLREMQARARAMALVHESLYRSKSLTEVDFGAYLEGLAGQVMAAVSIDPRVRLALESNEVRLHIEHALPCGLIVGELLTNALKYAFPPAWWAAQGERPAPVVRVAIRAAGDALSLCVADNGVGLPDAIAGQPSSSLGMQIVHALARQIGARLEVGDDPGRGGARFTLTFTRHK